MEWLILAEARVGGAIKTEAIMLKTEQDGRMYLITQPDHAQVAGYLAAHWGNNDFARPGYFAPVPDPERLRSEVVQAIAQHDNGWWEWEAMPELADADGLPAGLSEVLQNQQEGMNRWRTGLRRFDAPYVNLLISHHAYRLYASKARAEPEPALAHPLFWRGSPDGLLPGEQDVVVAFLAELKALQQQWLGELGSDSATAPWIEPYSLRPHARLLQLLDAVSLSLCSAILPARTRESKGLGEDEFELREVPRRSWDDRVTIQVVPHGGRRIVAKPYPFDRDPLPVFVPVRVIDVLADRERDFPTWWHAQPLEMIAFEYRSQG